MDTFASSIATTLLALAFVLVLAWVSLRVLKRLQQGRGAEAGTPGAAVPRFVRALPVGARERLVIVHYRGHEWMLGVTAGGISVLAREPLGEGTGLRPVPVFDPGGRQSEHGDRPQASPLP